MESFEATKMESLISVKVEQVIKILKPVQEALSDDQSTIQAKIDYLEMLIIKANSLKNFRFPIFGLAKAGKSTILNSLIGMSLLEEGSGITTKFACIIKHHESDVPCLWSAELKSEDFKNNGKRSKYKRYVQKDKLAEGIDKIKEYITRKNETMAHENNKITANYFLILKCKMPFLEGVDNELKEQLELIDMPGLNDQEEIFRIKLMPTITKRSTSFIYAMKNESINTNDDKDILGELKKVITEKNKNMNLINLQNLIVVLNKIDQISLADRNGLDVLVKKAQEHLEKSLEISLHMNVLPYSAKRELEKLNPSFSDYVIQEYTNFKNQNLIEDFDDHIEDKINILSKKLKKENIQVENMNEMPDMKAIESLQKMREFPKTDKNNLSKLCVYWKCFNKTLRKKTENSIGKAIIEILKKQREENIGNLIEDFKKERKNTMMFLKELLDYKSQFFEKKKVENAKIILTELKNILRNCRTSLESEIDKILKRVLLDIETLETSIRLTSCVKEINEKVENLKSEMKKHLGILNEKIKDHMQDFTHQITKLNNEIVELLRDTQLMNGFQSNTNFQGLSNLKTDGIALQILGTVATTLGIAVAVGAGVAVLEATVATTSAFLGPVGWVIGGIALTGIGIWGIIEGKDKLNEYKEKMRDNLGILKREFSTSMDDLKIEFDNKFDKVEEYYKQKMIPFIDLIRVDREKIAKYSSIIVEALAEMEKILEKE